MDSDEVKRIAYGLGADLCGIAPVSRLASAPEGFRPRDVLPECESVIAVAKRFPAATIRCITMVPYTITRNILSAQLDQLSVEMCCELEARGIAAVPTGVISHNQFDKQTGRWRSLVSAKHCAQAAGLGTIGRNSLLITPEYGNMVWLAAILCGAVFKPDRQLEHNLCETGCTRCVDNCPVHALGGALVDQQICHSYAFHTEPGEEFTFKCHACRTVCPHCLGSKNSGMADKEA